MAFALGNAVRMVLAVGGVLLSSAVFATVVNLSQIPRRRLHRFRIGHFGRHLYAGDKMREDSFPPSNACPQIPPGVAR